VTLLPSLFIRFIEFGELRGHLYGTSVDAIKDVLASEKICVIDIEPYVSFSHLILVVFANI